jgi:hypothetical protein
VFVLCSKSVAGKKVAFMFVKGRERTCDDCGSLVAKASKSEGVCSSREGGAEEEEEEVGGCDAVAQVFLQATNEGKRKEGKDKKKQ